MTDPRFQAYQDRVLLQRGSTRLDYPAHVHIETQAVCNAACNFCPYPTLERKGAVMDDALIDKIIGDLTDIPQIHKFQISPLKVSEPFMDRRIFDILEKIHTHLPNATVALTTNASPLTPKKLERLAAFERIAYLWVSFNDHRPEEYEAAMQLPYKRTIERLDMIHAAKAAGWFKSRVVLSRVGDGDTTNPSQDDFDFGLFVNRRYPLFQASLFKKINWLGQVGGVPPPPPPDIGCNRWFELSITATGVVAHCCVDGEAKWPIGNVRDQHVLEVYNNPEYRRLREATTSRLEVSPCNQCAFT